MKREIEDLIKIQGKVNDNYHLCVHTDLVEECSFVLFINFRDERDYFSKYNIPILSSSYGDTVDDLRSYLEKHNGFKGRGY